MPATRMSWKATRSPVRRPWATYRLIVATATSSEPITTDYATVQEGWSPTAHCPIPAALLAQTSRLRARPSD